MEDEVIGQLDYGHTSLYLLLASTRYDNARRRIEQLISATKFMEKAFYEHGRLDLKQKAVELRERLLGLYLINWEWLKLYSTSSYLPPEAHEDMKNLMKKLAEIEIIRLTLLDMLLDIGILATREDVVEVPTISWE